MKLPKKIWIFWYQGFLSSPSMVKMCINSWKLRNPSYEIIILDKNSIHQYIEIPKFISLNRLDITYQIYSDYIRLALLKKHGGVWVDAYVYCFVPLSKWLPNHFEKDSFFIFNNSFKGRLITSWFMVTTPKHYIFCQWFLIFEDYFRKNHLKHTSTFLGKKIQLALGKYLNKDINKNIYWFSFFIRRVLQISPYFTLHYKFNQLYLKNWKIRKDWDKKSKFMSGIVDIMYQPSKGVNFEIFNELYNQNKVPLFKLSHRLDLNLLTYKPYMNLIYKDYEELKNQYSNK